MDKAKIKRLEKAGWKVGSPYDFLGLSPEEIEYVEIKLALGEKVRAIRKKKKFSQAKVAKLMNSDQARVARIEAGDTSVSLDLQIRALIMLGVSRRDLGEYLSH